MFRPVALAALVVAASALAGCLGDSRGDASLDQSPREELASALPDAIEDERQIIVSADVAPFESCSELSGHCISYPFELKTEAILQATLEWTQLGNRIALELRNETGEIDRTGVIPGSLSVAMRLPLAPGQYELLVDPFQAVHDTYHLKASFSLPPDPHPLFEPIDGLDSPQAASVTPGIDGSLTFHYEFTTQAGVGAQGLSTPQFDAVIEVDERVAGAAIFGPVLPFAGTTDSAFSFTALDEGENILCSAYTFAGNEACRSPGRPTGPGHWSVLVENIGAVPGSVEVAFDVTLLPHGTFGDPAPLGIHSSLVFAARPTGLISGEDNLGFLDDGTLLVQNMLVTLRTSDEGVTWEDVTPDVGPPITGDPWLTVDARTGYVGVTHWEFGCNYLALSEDAGDSWVSVAHACGTPLGDHQKLAFGPSPLDVGIPAMYIGDNTLGNSPAYATAFSYDRGVTWTATPAFAADEDFYPRVNGNLLADQAGNVYNPFYNGVGRGSVGVAWSNDHGLTWKVATLDDEPGPYGEGDLGVAEDQAGRVYVAYVRPSGVFYRFTEDGGSTWSDRVKVSPPSVLTATQVTAVAGNDGRLAVAYRGTADDSSAPTTVSGHAAWHVFVSVVGSAASQTPDITTGLAHEATDPVQRGPICLLGGACQGARNLLDFIDIDVAPEGRVAVAYSDGCTRSDACPTPALSRDAAGMISFQEAGPNLRG